MATRAKKTTEPDATKKPKAKKAAAKPKKTAPLSAKDLATKNGESYINVVSLELDPNDINNGAFELDWNDKFLVTLIKSGYQLRKDDKDTDIVDRWFQTVCRNIVLEVYEQEMADPDNRLRTVRSRPLGDGRSEVS